MEGLRRTSHPCPRKKDADDIQIGEEAKPQTKDEIAKAQEKDHQTKLSEYFLESRAPEKERHFYSKLEDLREEKDKLEIEIPSVRITAEMKKPRETFVLGRGQYDNPKEGNGGRAVLVLSSRRPACR